MTAGLFHGCGSAGDGGVDTGEESFGCEVERWAGPGQPLRVFTCQAETGDSGPFACECDGRTQQQSAADCETALMLACDVDPELLEDYCTYETLGTCWPGDQGGFRCDCSAVDGPLVERAEQRCDEAIFRACGSACEDEAGRCEPRTEATGFDCVCEARTVSRPGEIECIYAHEFSCHPECEHAGGQCYVAPDNRGLECRCGDDRELTTILYDDAGHDDCDGILDDLCGPNPDVPETCERTGAAGSGRCQLPSAGGFSCDCTTENSNRAGGGSPAAPSCLEQLMEYCPEAFQ